MRIGKISSRPISIQVEHIHLLRIEKPAKFWEGPTALKPGPTLLIQDMIAEKLVEKSKLSRDISNVAIKEITK